MQFKKHIRVGKVHVEREHLKFFMLWTGAVLMIVDAFFSIFGHWMFGHLMEALETYVAGGGKFGAALAGAAAFFEKIMNIAEKVE